MYNVDLDIVIFFSGEKTEKKKNPMYINEKLNSIQYESYENVCDISTKIQK